MAGLMKAIPGFHPPGMLRTSDYSPGVIVDKPTSPTLL
jgi:hypothetical protein